MYHMWQVRGRHDHFVEYSIFIDIVTHQILFILQVVGMVITYIIVLYQSRPSTSTFDYTASLENITLHIMSAMSNHTLP